MAIVRRTTRKESALKDSAMHSDRCTNEVEQGRVVCD